MSERGRLARPILAAAVAATLVAALGSTMTELGPWYRSLAKPHWQPPDWLFGPAWTLIFALAALSAAFAWRDAPRDRHWTVALFAVNAALNVAWSALFFRFHRPDLALAEVALLWLSILVLVVYLWRRSRPAGVLLLPYLAWVSFASLLNYEIVRLNGPFGAA
jgi:tryptophan-rich sensory protein